MSTHPWRAQPCLSALPHKPSLLRPCWGPEPSDPSVFPAPSLLSAPPPRLGQMAQPGPTCAVDRPLHDSHLTSPAARMSVVPVYLWNVGSSEHKLLYAQYLQDEEGSRRAMERAGWRSEVRSFSVRALGVWPGSASVGPETEDMERRGADNGGPWF